MRRPNILILMVDQLTGTLFPDGPASWLHTPNLARLSERSLRFDRAYCASPLCAPSRASIVTGQLPSRTGVYDNAAEFASDLPTFAHLLRGAGYRTCLAGKMHFVGPDQLHGFEERLTTDIYPADFGWTPDWRRPGERIDWWYHNLGSVTGAGTAETTNQLDYDDDVAHRARRKLLDYARSPDDRPWALCVSFTHPHDPFVARPEFWGLYDDCGHLDPEVPEPPLAAQDPHSRRLLESFDRQNYALTPEQLRRARQGYFASISYVDAKIGEVLDTLRAMGAEQDTAVVFLSDHGEMLGERGLWFKMSFREGSARVPMLLAAPGLAPGRNPRPVSTLDLAPTLCEIAGADATAFAPLWDGESLLAADRGPVPMEYAAEGSVAPMVALVDGTWKYVACPADPPQLFDLAADPGEAANLAADPAHAGRAAEMAAEVAARWDLAAFDAAVRASQARRHAVYPALRRGAYHPWDFQPCEPAAERYMRNHMDLNVLEAQARFPRAE
jgi:choline-sulfatase